LHPLVADALSQFIEKRFSVDSREPTFTRDVHLWRDGFLDSLALAAARRRVVGGLRGGAGLFAAPW